MTATLHTFPALHGFQSSRSWALAGIVLIHMAFFWLLASGMGRSILMMAQSPSQVVLVPTQTKTVERPQRPVDPLIEHRHVWAPKPDVVQWVPDAESAPAVRDERPPQIDTGTAGGTVRTPVEVLPEIDPRRGWSEPVYPASTIREGIEGTVVLSLQVLENGRVGEVRIDQSSGDRRLDESAMREARRWRFVPGTRDGVPVVFWKQVPVTFRLQTQR
jgi:protein TonB